MNEYETVSKSVKIDIIDGLKDRLPQIFEDGKINLEKLKALLTGEIVEKEDDRFYFNWAGKSKLFKLIQEPGYGTLKPDKDRSIDFDNTENIVIVGENLETLKLLLKPYFGRVKMIYIDPPYNTGKDFIYRDNFKEPLKDYLEKTGQIDGDGSKLTTNTETSGRYHSDWLNFMYPRLFLARSLLREDGIIFISIDDNEVHNLRKICDEIFGENNFEANIIIQSNIGGRDYLDVAVTHEYLLCYRKSDLGELYEVDKKDITSFKYSDSNGNYELRELRNRNPKFNSSNRPNLFYPIYLNQKISDDYGNCAVSLEKNDEYSFEAFPLNSKGEESCWRWGKPKVLKNIVEDNPDKSQVVAKQKRDGNWNIYEKNRKVTQKVKSIWDEKEIRSERGTIVVRELFGGSVFDFPKPVELIQKALRIGTSEDDIVLDFLAGSGTAGHAIWDLNKEDGGNRKFILVNLDEPIDPNTEAGKNALSLGLKTIGDIFIERLRIVSEKYRNEEQQKLTENNQDFGFKVFRLDKSNFNLKYEFEISEDEDREELKRKYLDWLGLWINEPLVGDWKPIDIVYEIMLKVGFDLNSKIEERKIKGKKFFHVTDEKQELEFYMSLDEKITEEAIEEIRTPEYRDKVFVFLDKALSDNDKINLSAFVRLKVI